MLTKTVAKPATKSMTKTATRNSNKNSNKNSDKDSDKDIDKDSDDTCVSNRESAASGRDRGTLFDYLGWCFTDHIWRRIERLATVLTWGSQEYIRQIPFYTYSTNTDLLSCHSRVLFVWSFLTAGLEKETRKEVLIFWVRPGACCNSCNSIIIGSCHISSGSRRPSPSPPLPSPFGCICTCEK